MRKFSDPFLMQSLEKGFLGPNRTELHALVSGLYKSVSHDQLFSNEKEKTPNDPNGFF